MPTGTVIFQFDTREVLAYIDGVRDTLEAVRLMRGSSDADVLRVVKKLTRGAMAKVNINGRKMSSAPKPQGPANEQVRKGGGKRF